MYEDLPKPEVPEKEEKKVEEGEEEPPQEESEEKECEIGLMCRGAVIQSPWLLVVKHRRKAQTSWTALLQV